MQDSGKGNFKKRRCESAALKAQGNKSYQAEEYQEAAKLYTSALNLCPVAQYEERFRYV